MAKTPPKYAEGELVEIRHLPGDKHWQRATYVRRIRQDEMPATWSGPLGHVVDIPRIGKRTISVQRIRKMERSGG